jgi:hypothetical protein
MLNMLDASLWDYPRRSWHQLYLLVIKDLWNGMGVGDRLATIPSIIDIPFIRVALDWSRFLSSIPVLPNLRRQASFCGQSLVVNHSCRTL